MGREKKYRNAADKQRAYRKRRKAEKQQIDDAMAVLELVKSKVVTLRKSVELWRKQTKYVFINSNPRVKVHRVQADRFVKTVLEDTVFQYMLMTGLIEFTDYVHGDEDYDFTPAFNELEMD